jgi:hypothetical protein
MWKEVIVASFKVRCQHLPGERDENHETHQPVSGRDLSQRLPNTKQEGQQLFRDIPLHPTDFQSFVQNEAVWPTAHVTWRFIAQYK